MIFLEFVKKLKNFFEKSFFYVILISSIKYNYFTFFMTKNQIKTNKKGVI